MKLKYTILLAAALCSANVMADLKPDIIDCDGKKVARNAAMEATVGVSGKCDAGKMAKDTKDDVVDGAHDKVDDAKDKIDRKDQDHDRLKERKD